MFKPEKLTSNISGYEINGSTIISRSGREMAITDIKEADAKAKIVASKAGIKDPVCVSFSGCGNNVGIVPREVAEKALEQGRQEQENREYNLRTNVPGIDELKAAIAHNEEEQKRFSRTITSDAGKIYERDLIDVDALRAEFPRAAAYLEAESFCYSADYKKSILGKEAMEKIRLGEDCDAALSEMATAWKAYYDARALD